MKHVYHLAIANTFIPTVKSLPKTNGLIVAIDSSNLAQPKELYHRDENLSSEAQIHGNSEVAGIYISSLEAGVQCKTATPI